MQQEQRRWRRQPRHNKDNTLPEACDREMQRWAAGGSRLVLNFEINRGAVRYQKQGEIWAHNSTIFIRTPFTLRGWRLGALHRSLLNVLWGYFLNRLLNSVKKYFWCSCLLTKWKDFNQIMESLDNSEKINKYLQFIANLSVLFYFLILSQ